MVRASFASERLEGRAGIPLELALASQDYKSMSGVVVPYILAEPDQVVTVFAVPVQPT